MGPEIIAAILGPTLGGMISLSMWFNKKNSDHVRDGFDRLTKTVLIIERKIDDVRLDVAKNYVFKKIAPPERGYRFTFFLLEQS